MCRQARHKSSQVREMISAPRVVLLELAQREFWGKRLP